MIERHDFADKTKLASGLALAVAVNLQAGIAQRGAASLVVSGGSTPVGFFKSLSQIDDVAWDKVTITLVDERWVDDRSDRSNARLVKENLLQNNAKDARFVPLYSGGELPGAEQINQTNARLTQNVPTPFDAVVLGMGNDGHTASFFPGGDTLDLALSDNGPAIAISAPGAEEDRVTLTLPTLLNTASLYLHIEGAQKSDTLSKAMNTTKGGNEIAEMPVRAVLIQKQKTIQLYWCP